MSSRSLHLHSYPRTVAAKEIDFRPLFAAPGGFVLFDTDGLVSSLLGQRLFQAISMEFQKGSRDRVPEIFRRSCLNGFLGFDFVSWSMELFRRSEEIQSGAYDQTISRQGMRFLRQFADGHGIGDVEKLESLVDQLWTKLKLAFPKEISREIEFGFAELRIENGPEVFGGRPQVYGVSPIQLDPGHVDAGVVAIVVPLYGERTLYQQGPGVRNSRGAIEFDPDRPIEKVGEAQGIAFAGTEMSELLADKKRTPLVHGRPSAKGPRVLLVLRAYLKGKVL